MIGGSWVKRAAHLIEGHVNEKVQPIAATPCICTVCDGWTGIAAIDETDLWLVNADGARRAPLDMIDLVDIDYLGELPTYSFAFHDSSQRFNIQPMARLTSMSFRAQLLAVFRPISYSIPG